MDISAVQSRSCGCNSPFKACVFPDLLAFQLMLSQHDLQLGGHLQQLGVPLLERVWRIMSGGMSDLLPAADDWLVLWDHCLAAPSGPAFYNTVLAAYLMTQRTHLLAVTNQQQLDRVFAARPAVDVRKVGRNFFAFWCAHGSAPGAAHARHVSCFACVAYSTMQWSCTHCPF